MSYGLKFAFIFSFVTACNSPSSSPQAPAQRASAQDPVTAAPTLPEVAADSREALLAKGVAHMLENEHLRHKRIDDEVSREAFSEYLKMLDPGKMFLLKDDVASLRAYETQMDDQVRAANLTLARAGTAMVRKRQQAIAARIASLLQTPFDFTVAEEMETDPDKLDWSPSENDLLERWRKILKLQVLERITTMEEMAKAVDKAKKDSPEAKKALAALKDVPATFEGKEKKAREELAESFAARFIRLEATEPLEPAEMFLNALATVYDPHTVYLAPADKENFDIQMTGSLEGIGALLGEKDHYISVTELVPGGASWRQGDLEAGDIILAVAQAGKEPVEVIDMRIDKVVQMIRGPKGSLVTLTVKKPDGRIVVVPITRDVVEIEAAYARGAVLDLGPKHPAMGYIYLPSFYGNTRHDGSGTDRSATQDVKKLLGELSKRNVNGVVLDLRGNGGGLLEHARDIAGLFIKQGPIVQTRYSTGEAQVLEDDDPSIAFGGEVVVLVDRFSASASEIVAAALQDYRRAVIVGTAPTHGKGTVQVLLDLDKLRPGLSKPLGVLKLTVQQFFRVDGDSTQWRGVVPDVLLPDPVAHIESGERYLDHSIPWSEVEALPYEVWPSSPWDVDTLIAQSMVRRTKQPSFAKIEARGALFKSRQADTMVPLEREAWMARRKRDEQALEAVDPELDKSKDRFSVNVIEYDGRKAIKDKDGSDAVAEWKQNLAHDPWVQEALYVLADMHSAGVKTTKK